MRHVRHAGWRVAVRIAQALAPGDAGEEADAREARAAVAIAAALYLVGALLCATAVLLPHVASPAGVLAVALDALASAAALFYAAERGWGGLRLAFVADLWGVAVIAVLCASGGGADSPFALIYFFAIGHAAAFQPRARYLLVSVAGLLAYLAPLLYEAHVSSVFGAVACVGIVLALLTSLVVHTALERLREQRRRLKILIAATAELDRSLDPAQTLSTIAHMAVPDLAALCVIDVLQEDGSPGRILAAGVDAALAARIERARAGDPSEDGAERAIREAGYRAAAVLEMSARGRAHGTISFWAPKGAAGSDAGLLAVLEDLTQRAAMALDNARLYAERALVARTLRRSLMPAVLPALDGLELASYFRPMGAGDEVGGDFYDAFGDRDALWLVIGDVCGKGAEAAALTGFLRHTIAAYSREQSSPAAVLAQVNRAMLDQDFDGCFATAALAHLRFHGSRADATLALGGHPAALLVRGDATVAEFGGAGALLGVIEEPGFAEDTVALGPGDSLVLYTDGLVEAHAPERILSVEAMSERLRTAQTRSADSAIESLLGLLDVDGRVRDDIAILAARVAG